MSETRTGRGPAVARTRLEGLWTSAETAEFIGIQESTLRKWRSAGRGPAWITRGRLVRYVPARVVAWIEEGSS